ncbi:MAG: magnesium transporter [Planctomycetia bacterium]|nr:magnesium transporter [Planctomycetia bacterium]
MAHPLFGPEVKMMLAEKNSAGLREFCESLHPATVAEALEDFTPEQIWEAISSANIRTQASIFEYLPLALQVEMAEKARPQVGQLLSQMSHDDRVDLLRRLPPRVTEAIMRLVDEADRKDIATLFQYGENTVGSLMTTDYAWLPGTLTTAEAIDQLRQQAPDRETIYYIYVLDDPVRRPDGSPAPRRLLGVVSLRDLILAPRHALIRELMETDLVTLRYDEDAEAVAQLFARYDLIAVPVVDEQFGLLGIVTHDDVLDVVTREATEDLQRQGAVGPLEGNYLEASMWAIWKSRAFWLAFLFILQMGTINVMAHYEGKLEPKTEQPQSAQTTANAKKTTTGLAFMIVFIPLCLSVGGNAGSQAATLVTRALALEHVRVADWFRVFRRETLIAAALAATLGILAIVRTYFLTPDNIQEKVPPGMFWYLVWVVTFAVMGICLTGAVVGSMLPIAIKAIGKDPALMSAPFIATLSDVLGIAIFFNIVILFF